MRFFALLLCAFMLAAPLTPAPALALEKTVQQTYTQPQLKQMRLKKPVRIKLKRNAKDDYTWELSGDDPDEVVRTDSRLRKLLNVQ